MRNSVYFTVYSRNDFVFYRYIMIYYFSINIHKIIEEHFEPKDLTKAVIKNSKESTFNKIVFLII